MNKFVSSLLGAFAGTWIAFFVFGFLIFFFGIAVLSSVSFSSVVAEINDNSILTINLTGTINDRPSNKTIQELIEDNQDPNENLHEILLAIKNAETNDKIKGICLNCGNVSTGFATASAIRNALSDFKKKSGKRIYAYGHSFSQKDYYIATVADSVFMNPVGQLDIHGLTSTTMFYKGALDKLGIDMQILRVGSFKSAVEPFTRTSMSEESKLQTQTFIDNIWESVCSDIAKARKVEVATVKEFADSLYAFDKAEVAVSKKLVDGTCYQHQFEDKLRRLSGLENGDELNLVSAYTAASQYQDASYSDKIAVLYAEGEIYVTGDNKSINSADIVPQIIGLADDESVKGLVLRVNSPGGSAYASEQIWEALEYFKSKKKPFAVSMGDNAASGGYYIACGADRIFAEPSTITGSIGIFGMIPSVKNLMNDKLGITTDFVTTTPNANLSVFEPLTPSQINAVQESVDNGYELFTSRCAKGRKMPVDSIRKIAEGRVWDGTNALAIGLIDQYGGIDDAVRWVAKKASIDDYSTEFYPEHTPDFINILYNTIEVSVKTEYLPNKQWQEYVMKVQGILKKDRIQCRMEDIYIY